MDWEERLRAAVEGRRLPADTVDIAACLKALDEARAELEDSDKSRARYERLYDEARAQAEADENKLISVACDLAEAQAKRDDLLGLRCDHTEMPEVVAESPRGCLVCRSRKAERERDEARAERDRLAAALAAAPHAANCTLHDCKIDPCGNSPCDCWKSSTPAASALAEVWARAQAWSAEYQTAGGDVTDVLWTTHQALCEAVRKAREVLK